MEATQLSLELPLSFSSLSLSLSLSLNSMQRVMVQTLLWVKVMLVSNSNLVQGEYFYRLGGAVRPPSPPRHDIMAPEEPFHVRGLIFFLFYELFDPHMFKQVLVYFPLPFRLPGGFFPFRDPIREALLLCEPSYSL